MPVITFIHSDNRQQQVEAAVGETVMQVVTGSGIDDIVAECGGNAMCATCHVYVDEGFADRLDAVGDNEHALLDGVAAERRPTSRLSCQITITQACDGLVLRLPDRQI